MPGQQDQAIWEYFESVGFPAEEHVRMALAELAAADGPLSTPALEARVPLSRTRLELMLKVLDVDGAARRVKGGWLATGEEWAYDGERYAKVAEARRAEQQAMREYIASSGCRMRFLRERLDDPGAVECGRCDNCIGRPVVAATSRATVEAAAARLARPGVPIEVKARWPQAMEGTGVAVKGAIPLGERHEVGRAVARFSDLGHGSRVRSIVGPGHDDIAVPGDLVAAAVKVLGVWKGEWPVRPVGIVAVGSLSRSELVRSFAAGIGAAGKLPVLGTVPHTGASRVARTNSAIRLKSVLGAYALPPALSAQIAGELAGQPLFLVDDYVDSGWTLTIVSRLLRMAGAGQIYPLALGLAG